MTKLAAISLLAVSAFAERTPRDLEGVGVEEKLGQKIDMELKFTSASGRIVRLGDYFNQGKPVVITMVYFSCPMLCNMVLNGFTSLLRELPWSPGSEFDVLTISIDPRETFELAAAKKQTYLASYDRPAPGWRFLTDLGGTSKLLAEQLGFHYRYNDSLGQYAHSAAFFVLTPDGRISRYVYGIKYKVRDFRLAVTEASELKVGSTLDKLLLYCFRYDAHSNGYVMYAMNLMRVGSAAGVIALSAMIWKLRMAE